MIVMSPPLILSEGQIDEIAGILRESISSVIDGLKKEKLL